MTAAETADEILALFATRGHAEYYGEAVSQREHALQAARLAEEEGAADSLVIAALLHDVGHLLTDLPEDAAERGPDDRHEALGAAWLSARLVPEVAEVVRLHVVAKRYLCAVEPGYFGGISRASVTSLALQGGPMDEAEASRFEAHPLHGDAVRLRLWDDAAKVPGLEVPGLEHYRGRLAAAVREGGAS